ncbi:MAG: Flp1 family type IVb pilin [Clostridium sp.]
MLIGLVIIFKTQIRKLLETIFKQIETQSKKCISVMTGKLGAGRAGYRVCQHDHDDPLLRFCACSWNQHAQPAHRWYLQMAASSAMDSVFSQVSQRALG